MIINLPSYEDFENVSKECLIQSFILLFKVYDNYVDHDDDIVSEISMDDVWEYNKGTLRTCIILLHQGIETYMKGIVAKTTPLLLLEQKRSDWPTLPTNEDKDYDVMFTIAGENLLNTFCAVSNDIATTSDLINFIEGIRKKRNKAIHGATKISISATSLIHDILKAYNYFFGIGEWFEDLKKFSYKNPLFGYIDWEFESLLSYRYLEFVESTISTRQMKKYINFDMNGRRYFCPTCKYEIDRKFGDLQSKWAYLAPNKPNSNKVYCINCGFESEVIRKDCEFDGCKGNVLDIDERCLTCFT